MSRRILETEKLAGVAEVAEFCGVSRQAVSNWQTRGVGLPAPVCELDCGPIYYLPDIEKWLRQTGRKPA